MGAVYAATHRNGNRVALKVLHTHLSADADVRARFAREGYVANAVNHPGVVRVLDDGEADEARARVAVAEERFWGGTCVNVGCVPKKLLVQAGEYGGWADDAAGFGVHQDCRGVRPSVQLLHHSAAEREVPVAAAGVDRR